MGHQTDGGTGRWLPVYECESCGGDAFGSSVCALCLRAEAEDEAYLVTCSGCGAYAHDRMLHREHVTRDGVCGEYC